MPDRSPDSRILSLAASTQGRVTRRALLADGVGRGAIARRLESGRLTEALPGVYAVGHRGGGIKGRLMEAWLYGGEDSVLCGRGAGAFWQMGAFAEIDVAAPRRRRGTGRIVFHRLDLLPQESILREALRVTTPARTLLDLAALIPPAHLQRVFTEAEVLGHVDQRAIARVLAAHPGARGSRELARLAGLDRGLVRRGSVRSRLEILYRGLVESTDLDFPEYGYRVDLPGRAYVLDAFHVAARVAVELDGRGPHGAEERFGTDRERDRRLLAIGIRTVRLAEEHFERPGELYDDLVAVVGRRGLGGSARP